ncbi:hypothetical protein BH23VER1_BH23VER1_16450 [soil metagenome]
MDRAKYLALTLVVLASDRGCKPSGGPSGEPADPEGDPRVPRAQGEVREEGSAREPAGERTSTGLFVRGSRREALAFARDAWAVGGLVPDERVGVHYSDPRPPDGDGNRFAYLSFSIGDEDPGGFARRLAESWDRIPRRFDGEGTPATVRELSEDDPPLDKKRDLRLYGDALGSVSDAGAKIHQVD